MAVKLRKPSAPPAENGTAASSPETRPIKPLVISGLVVGKSALVDGLRLFLPALTRLEVLDDGERFQLGLDVPAAELQPGEPAQERPATDPAQPIPIPPLSITAVVVTKAALIAALRLYVPALTDIQVFDDGERFLLVIEAPTKLDH